MGKATGFMEYERNVPKERDPLARIKDWKEYQLPLAEEKLRNQGARCMDCGTPFCHTGMEFNGQTSGCPLNNLIPEWNDLVYRGKWKAALNRLLKTNNFPEFTGRVCPAPCEGACTVAISDPAVAIKTIEQQIIDKGFDEGWIVPNPPKSRTGKKVAIVGSGPAGLAAADQLNKAGHYVTVYERADRVGGLLTYGIPNMKLEKEIVDRRVRLLEDEGITFITNTEIGMDITAEELKKTYDSILLCGGAQKHRDLTIEGRELNGIHYAMDYLTTSTKSLLDSNKQPTISAKGKRVVVIGGGDTGADCVATALRQGCESIVQFGKYPQLTNTRPDDNPWPEVPNTFKLDYAYAEANAQFGRDPREYAISTKKFVGDQNGNLIELHTIQMKKVVGENGKVQMVEVPGTERVWPVDLVFVAIGFTGPNTPLLDQFKVEKTNRNTAQAAYGDYRTTVDGIFAAGDMRRGQSLIVWAIHEGREAARECDRYLMGTTRLP